MNRYEGKDNYGNPKLNYLNSVKAMPEEELFEETKSKIWLSAYANNNPRSDYHWHVDACYTQWEDRDRLEEYSRAYDEVVSNN